MKSGIFMGCIVSVAVLAVACSKPSETTAVTPNANESNPLQKSNNWLLGQWVVDFGEGFSLEESCKRPDYQFGHRYTYWRGDVDGDPYEELNRVDHYLGEGKVMKIKVIPPTGAEPSIHPDGYMHFERLGDNRITLIDPKWPDTNVTFEKCQTSPLPYSADEAPTPPPYQGIEPGIVDRPRDGT